MSDPLSPIGWLGQLGDGVLALIPRPEVIRSTEGGVRWWFGAWPKELRAGIRWNWPLIMDWATVPIVDDVIELPVQTLTVDGDASIEVAAVLGFRIKNPFKALTECEDIDSQVRMDSLVAVSQFILGKEVKWIREWIQNPTNQLTEIAQSRLTRYGVTVNHLSLVQITKVQPMKHFGISSTAFTDE